MVNNVSWAKLGTFQKNNVNYILTNGLNKLSLKMQILCLFSRLNKNNFLLSCALILMINGVAIGQILDYGINEFLEDKSLLEKRTYSSRRISSEELFAIRSLDRNERILQSKIHSRKSTTFTYIQYNEKWHPVERVYLIIDSLSGDTTLKTISNFIYDERGKLIEYNTFGYRYEDFQKVDLLPKRQEYFYGKNDKYLGHILKYYSDEDENKYKQVKTEYLIDRWGRVRTRSIYETEGDFNDFRLRSVYSYKYFPFTTRKRKEELVFLYPDSVSVTHVTKYKYINGVLVRSEKRINGRLKSSNDYIYQNDVLIENHIISNVGNIISDFTLRYEYVKIENDN